VNWFDPLPTAPQLRPYLAQLNEKLKLKIKIKTKLENKIIYFKNCLKIG
jgi:hypothetical protein